MAHEDVLPDDQVLVTAIGEYTLSSVGDRYFRSLSLILNPESGEVRFDMDLRNPSRENRHKVIAEIMDRVYPMFVPDDVSFTFIFSEHAASRASNSAPRSFAVA